MPVEVNPDWSHRAARVMNSPYWDFTALGGIGHAHAVLVNVRWKEYDVLSEALRIADGYDNLDGEAKTIFDMAEMELPEPDHMQEDEEGDDEDDDLGLHESRQVPSDDPALADTQAAIDDRRRELRCFEEHGGGRGTVGTGAAPAMARTVAESGASETAASGTGGDIDIDRQCALFESAMNSAGFTGNAADPAGRWKRYEDGKVVESLEGKSSLQNQPQSGKVGGKKRRRIERKADGTVELTEWDE